MKKDADAQMHKISLQLKAGAEALEVLTAIQSLIDELLEHQQEMVADALKREQEWFAQTIYKDGLNRVH